MTPDGMILEFSMTFRRSLSAENLNQKAKDEPITGSYNARSSGCYHAQELMC
jgi:hypothetical protein